MIRDTLIDACCALDRRLPLLRPLWHQLWRLALARVNRQAGMRDTPWRD